MPKSELKTHSILINCIIKEYELRVGIVGTVLALSESNFEIDLTSHYRELTELQYPMYITTRHQVLSIMTYYPLHADSP